MGKYEFRKLVSNQAPVNLGYSDLLNLGDQYILANSGMLLDCNGNLVWKVQWEHYFSHAVYIKGKQILLTNRNVYLGMAGEHRCGIACIDMKNGQYKWKHFYDEYHCRLALRKKEPDINMAGGIGPIDINENCLYTGGFKVNLDDGSYEYMGLDKVRIKEDENIVHSKSLKSLKEMLHINSEYTSMIDIKVNIIYINGLEFSKEGYFFNKCDFIMAAKDNIYFFGVPAKRNTRNTIMFKYSIASKEIQEEVELPFRAAPEEIYDYLGKGVLIISGGELWQCESFQL